MDLRGPWAKFDWAVQKLEALDSASKTFLQTQPLRVVDEFDDEAGCHVLRLRHRKDPKWSFRLGLMVGDVVHNARSALDQVAWLLACRSNPVNELWDPKIAWQIAFPVTRGPGRFKTHKVIPFLAEDAITVLEALQPYKGGDTPECIGWLDRLWNIDKHRVIHSSTLLADISPVKFRPGAHYAQRDLIEHPPVTTWSNPPDRVEDGAEIARIRFNEGLGPPFTVVEVTGQPTLDVAFGAGDFMLSVDALGGPARRDHARSQVHRRPSRNRRLISPQPRPTPP